MRGAVQQYQKAVGPINNRVAFSDFLQQNKGKFQVTACVPVDVDRI